MNKDDHFSIYIKKKEEMRFTFDSFIEKLRKEAMKRSALDFAIKDIYVSDCIDGKRIYFIYKKK